MGPPYDWVGQPVGARDPLSQTPARTVPKGVSLATALLPLPCSESRNELLGIGHLILNAKRAIQEIQDGEGNSDSSNTEQPE